jgi:hypothetical protein
MLKDKQILYAAQTANTIFAGPITGSPSIPSYRNLVSADIRSFSHIQNGNTYGVDSTIGTIDNFNINFITNNITRVIIDTDGNVGIGTNILTEKFNIVGYSLAMGYKIPNGLSTQFLKADGSIDNFNPSNLTLSQILTNGNSTGGNTINSPDGKTSIYVDDGILDLFITDSIYYSPTIKTSEIYLSPDVVGLYQTTAGVKQHILVNSLITDLTHSVKIKLNSPINEVSQNPTTNLGIATKQYVDSSISSIPIITLSTIGNNGLSTLISNILNVPAYTLSGLGGIGGSGTLNYLPKFTPDGVTLGNSQIYDDGTNVGIGTTTPTHKLEIVSSANNYAFLGGSQSVIRESASQFLQFSYNATGDVYLAANDIQIYNPVSGKSVVNLSGGIIGALYSYNFSDYLFKSSTIAGVNAFEINHVGFFGQNRLGINVTPTATAHFKGSSAVSTDYALKIDNSANTSLFSIKNDGTSQFQNGFKILSTANAASVNGLFPIFGGYGGSFEADYFGAYIGVSTPFVDFGNSGYTRISAVAGVITYHASSGNIFDSGVSIKGLDSTSLTYSLKSENSTSTTGLYVRNDGFTDIITNTQYARILTNVSLGNPSFVIQDLGTGTAFQVDGFYGRIKMGTSPSSFNTSATLNIGSYGLGKFLNFGQDGRQMSIEDADGTGIIIKGKNYALSTNEFLFCSDSGLYQGNNNTTASFLQNVAIGFIYSPSTNIRFYVQGLNSVSTSFSAQFNSSTTSLLSIRNDGQVSSGLGYWINGNLILSNTASTQAPQNTIVGYMGVSVLGNNITGLGYQSLSSNSGNTVVGLGYQSLQNNSGDFSIGVGYIAGANNIGAYAIGIGVQSVYNNSGGYVIGLGYQSLSSNSGNAVISLGYQASLNNSGSNAFIIGTGAGINNIQSNVALIGASATGGVVGFLDVFLGTGINRTTETIHYVNLRQGTAKTGELNIAPAGASGSTQNSSIEALKITQSNTVVVSSLIGTGTRNINVDSTGKLIAVPITGGTVNKYSTTFTPGLINVANTITHSLGTTDIIVELWDLTSNEEIIAKLSNRTINTVDVTFTSNPVGNVRIIIIG